MSSEREPLIRAPWPAAAAAIIIVGAYLLQGLAPQGPLLEAYAFAPVDLQTGRWFTSLTAIFLHGGMAHALMNAAGALAFGAPVSRWLGRGLAGATGFFAYALLCGLIGNLGYGLVHSGEHGALVGASGAVSGLMGGAVRILAGRGAPGPYLSPTVTSMTIGWIAVNLIFAVFGAPGLGAPVAWEAHLFGYAAGLVLIGPFGWAARPRDGSGPWGQR